jgi:cytochrome c-type biogenesis protein
MQWDDTRVAVVANTRNLFAAKVHDVTHYVNMKSSHSELQRRMRVRREDMQQPPRGVSLLLFCLLVSVSTTHAFVPSRPWIPSSSLLRPLSTETSSSRTKLAMVNWDEFIYNAESVASQLASSVLNVDSVVGATASTSSSWLQSLPIMYGAGLLTSVSPCVWGLLPLTMSYISTAAGEREDRKATIPTLVFAAGLASVFCGMGLVAATVGTLFGSNGNSDDWSSTLVPLMSSGICLIMGLQLVDLIKLPLPSLDFLTPPQPKFRSSRRMMNQRSSSGGDSSLFIVDETLNDSSLVLREDSGLDVEIIDVSAATTPTSYQQRQQRQMDERGSLFRTFLLGGSSALVASPCATPVLTSILAYVANTNHPDPLHNVATSNSLLSEHSPLFGAILLFCYTLGYATPLLLVAASGGQFLVNMRNKQTYGKIAPWITPMTAGVLLWYGTSGVLTALFGDPSLAGLAPMLE